MLVRIGLLTDGGYPYATGESTLWCDRLVRGLPQHEFDLFALSRSAFRPAVTRFMAGRSRLRRLDELIARDGWRFACLLRASPVMPFAITSYALGLSSIRLRDYCIGTLAAMPALFGYVLLGALAGSGVAAWSSSNPFAGWLLAVGAVATLALTLRVGQLVARVVRPPAPVGEGAAP